MSFVTLLLFPEEGWSHHQVGPLQMFHIQGDKKEGHVAPFRRQVVSRRINSDFFPPNVKTQADNLI